MKASALSANSILFFCAQSFVDEKELKWQWLIITWVCGGVGVRNPFRSMILSGHILSVGTVSSSALWGRSLDNLIGSLELMYKNNPRVIWHVVRSHSQTGSESPKPLFYWTTEDPSLQKTLLRNNSQIQRTNWWLRGGREVGRLGKRHEGVKRYNLAAPIHMEM